MYDPQIERWHVTDPLAEKTISLTPYQYGNNDPLLMIDVKGMYAVSVHYRITYESLLKLGYSKKKADLIAHYSSTFANHPSPTIMAMDMNFRPAKEPGTFYRDIDYSKTKESQDEKNSTWHSMMSDKEAAEGMTEEQATRRGLAFGWDMIFDSNGGEDLEKLGQGLHALQDAVAHKGVRTSDHLGLNSSSMKMVSNDLYGSTGTAENLTRSAMIVVGVLRGAKD